MSGPQQDAFQPKTRIQAVVRCLLIPLNQEFLLTPSTTVAEVTVGGVLDPVQNAPAWLLGIMGWRGRRVPLIDFELVAGISKTPSATGRVVVLNTLGGNPHIPFIALPVVGIPRLFPADPKSVSSAGERVGGVALWVKAGESPALIPDIDALEGLLSRLNLKLTATR